MNEELQSLVERAMAAGRSREQILTVLKDNGLDDAGVLSVDSYIKKKSPSDLEESASQSDLRPSVSESLSSERVQLGFDEAAIKQQKKAIADAAAAQVYTAVAQTKGDLNKIQDKQAFANAYTTYRSLSDDPRAATLPQNPVTQTGEVDYAVVPTLKKGAIDYVNELIKQEQQRKADLGSKFTVPVLSEVAVGAEKIVGGFLKFNEMITGQNSELASFFLDDAAQRSRDALIDYGRTEEEISKGFLGNLSEGNIGAALTIFGSTLVQQVPQLAAVAATGGAAGLGLLGASAAGSGYAELQNRSDLSEGEKMLYGIGVGAAEYLAERLFLGDVNMLRKAFSKEAIEGMTKKELGDMLFGAVPKGIRSVMEEGAEEVLTSVAQQTLAKVIAGEEFNPIEIAESAIYGGAAGGGVYLLSRGVGAIVDPENEANIRKLRNEINKISEAEQQPDLTEAEKEALLRRKEASKQKLDELKRKDDEIVAAMTDEDRVELGNIQREIKTISNNIKSAKTEEGKKQLRDELRLNIERLIQLKSKYDSQKEARVPSAVVEGETIVEAQPIERAGQEEAPADRVLQAREKLILESIGMDATLQAVERGEEIDLNDANAVQGRILELIDDIDKSDIPAEAKQAYIQTLEDKFDELEYYDNKTITTTEQVTEEVPVGAPRAGSRTVVEPEVRRGKLRLFERLNNLEVATGQETEGQVSVLETQGDGSIDVVTYEKKTQEGKKEKEWEEVNRQPRVAENILGLEYVESILDDNGEVTGVVMRPATAKGEDESPMRIRVVNRPELSLDIAIDARKKQIGDIPEVIWVQEYETVTREVTTKERVPAKERPARRATEAVLPTETETIEEVVEETVEEPVVEERPKNRRGLSEKQVNESVDKAEKLAKRLGLPTKFVVFNSRAEYNKAVNESSKTGLERNAVEQGRFLPSTNEIYLNLEDITAEVPFHEVFHAAFITKFAKSKQTVREKEALDFYNGISKILRNGNEQEKLLADAVDSFVQAGSYTAKESPEEFLAQTAGFLSTSGDKISKSTMDKLIQWLNNFISKIAPGVKITTKGDFIDFMNSFSGALFELNGKRTTQTVNLESTDNLLESSSRGAFTISYFEDADQYKKFKDDGLVVNNYSLDRIVGQPVATHQPDNFMVGDVKLGDKVVVEGDGGVYFVLKFGEVWASGKPSSASGIAKAINWSRENSTDGKGRLLLARGTTPKLISSTKGVKGAMQIMEEMVERNLIPRKDFRASLIRVGKKYGIDFSGNDSMIAIKNDIEQKFMKPSDSTFAKRGSFFEDLVSDLASTSPVSKENISGIRDFLGSTKRISFSKEGITSAIAELMTERMLLDLPSSNAYAVIEVDEDVKVVKSKKHDSYPYSIVQESGKRPTLYLLNKRPKAVEVLKTKDGEKASNAKIGFAQMGYGRAIVDPALGQVTEQEQKTYDNILKESSSKSLDELNEATKAGLVIHATKRDFDTFNPERIYSGQRAVYGYGFYFTGSPSKAMDYGDKFIFTPISKYNLVDVEAKVDANYIEFLEEQYTKLSRIIDEQDQDTDVNVLRKNLSNIGAIISNMKSTLKDGKTVTIDATRKRLDDAYKMNYREFSDAFKALGYDGFQVDDYYQVVIFNFDKLNENLVKDEKKYIAEEKSNYLYDELLESSSKEKYQLGIQASEISYDIEDQLKESKPWQKRERTEMERYIDLGRIALQDRLYGVIQLQEDIEYSTGKPVGLGQDFRNAEVLMHGKAANDLTESTKMAEAVVANVKKAGVTLEEFDDLLYALHAQERNRYIRVQRTNIAKSLADLRKNADLKPSEVAEMTGISPETYREIENGTVKGGVTVDELNNILSVYGLNQAEFFTMYSRENAGSGMSDADAQEILSKYDLNPVNPDINKLKPALRDAVKGVKGIVSDTRTRMFDFGLETFDTLVAFEETYKNYVPLTGFEAEDSASEIIGGGRSLEVRGRPKRAMGRKSKADSPFLNAVAQNQSTIVRARKNEVAQKLYNLASDNPNKDIWKVIDPSVNKEYKKKITKKGIKDTAKTISDYINDDRNFAVRVDGKYKFVQFTDPKMAEALRGANVVKADFLVKTLGKFNRVLSSFITTYDPEFVLRNFSRDIQTAVINTMAEQEIEGGLLKGKNITAKIVKSTPESIKAIFKMAKKGAKPTTEFERYYAEFVEDGAKTEWFYSKSIDELRKDVNTLIEGKGDNALQAAGKFVERINTSVENGVRLASYIESRKAGLSREKAAELAKGLTVNFNKSGSLGPIANSLYLFFNASVQGTSRLIRTLKPQFKKNDDGSRSLQLTNAQKIALSMFVAGSIMSLLNEALSDDDEDGKSFYSKIPDFEKERNIIIMSPNGKDYVKIPLPYGLNVFYVSGNAMADAGQGIKSVGEVATNITEAAVGSFSPINFPSSEDFSSWMIKFVTPTVGQIPLSIALNEDYFGRTIYNENFPLDPTPKPESELGRKGASALNSWIAKELNKLTGGSEFRSGIVDINPDKVDFVLGTISGGAGRFAGRVVGSTVEPIVTGNWDKLESNQIPFARVFYGQPRKFVDLQDYFDKRIEVNQYMEEVKAKQMEPKDASRVVGMYSISRDVDRALKNLRKLEKAAENIKDKNAMEERLLQIEKLRYAQLARFQKAYDKYKINEL